MVNDPTKFEANDQEIRSTDHRESLDTVKYLRTTNSSSRVMSSKRLLGKLFYSEEQPTSNNTSENHSTSNNSTGTGEDKKEHGNGH